MISADTIAKVDAYWASYFGCKAPGLNGKQTLVFTHPALAGYDGALAFRHGEACIVSVPESTPEVERAKLRAAAPAEVLGATCLARVFSIDRDTETGASWVGLAG